MALLLKPGDVIRGKVIRNGGASTNVAVSGATVTEAVTAKRSSCSISAGLGLEAFLTLDEGSQVVSCGTVDWSDEQRGTLWVVAPWWPERPGGVELGEVDVSLVRPRSKAYYEVLQAVGVWRDGQIVDAEVSVAEPTSVRCAGPQDLPDVSDLGADGFARLMQQLCESSGAPVLATGMRGSAVSIDVLYVTAPLVLALENMQYQWEVGTAIAPLACWPSVSS